MVWTLAREGHLEYCYFFEGSRKHVVPTPHQRGVSNVVMDSVHVPPEEKRSSFWRNYAQEVLNAKLKETLNKNKAKNGILFIGDGMSVPTIMAARVYAGQLKGELGEGNTLAFERFPVTGLARVRFVNAFTYSSIEKFQFLIRKLN